MYDNNILVGVLLAFMFLGSTPSDVVRILQDVFENVMYPTPEHNATS